MSVLQYHVGENQQEWLTHMRSTEVLPVQRRVKIIAHGVHLK